MQRDEFIVLFQPVIDLGTGIIAGAEALIRWNHPDRGLLSPAEFLEVAEETGLIVPLGHTVLTEACRRFTELPTGLGGGTFGLAVNLSARELREPTVVEYVREHPHLDRARSGPAVPRGVRAGHRRGRRHPAHPDPAA